MAEHSTAPPWDLAGTGYILLYRLSRNFAAQQTRFGEYRGGFSAVMLVDYQTSNVGPYHEVLFIPGVVKYPHGRGYSISRIYVSTQISVDKGIENWAIPKQLATFTHESADSTDTFTVTAPDKTKPFLDIRLRSGGIQFPITGMLLPRLYQYQDGHTYITRLKAQGRGQLAHIESITVADDYFPDLSQHKPLLAIKIQRFSMQFPVPIIK